MRNLLKKIICLCICLILLSGCDKKDRSSLSNEIKDIYVYYGTVLAIDENDDLYVCGSFGNLDGYKSNDVMKVASNAKTLVHNPAHYAYIGNDNNVYAYSNLFFNKKFRLVKENVNLYDSIVACAVSVDKNNDLYVTNYFSSVDKDACGIGETFDISKYNTNDEESDAVIKSNYENSFISANVGNVKDIFISYSLHGYIDMDNNMYAKQTQDGNYTKVLSNVKEVSNGRKSYLHLVLTNDNILYEYSKYGLNKIADNVVEIDHEGQYFKRNDGKYYVYEDHSFTKSDKVFNNYYEITLNDIEKIWFIGYSGNIVYLSNDNKIIIYKNDERHIFDNEITNIKSISDLT